MQSDVQQEEGKISWLLQTLASNIESIKATADLLLQFNEKLRKLWNDDLTKLQTQFSVEYNQIEKDYISTLSKLKLFLEGAHNSTTDVIEYLERIKLSIPKLHKEEEQKAAASNILLNLGFVIREAQQQHKDLQEFEAEVGILISKIDILVRDLLTELNKTSPQWGISLQTAVNAFQQLVTFTTSSVYQVAFSAAQLTGLVSIFGSNEQDVLSLARNLTETSNRGIEFQVAFRKLQEQIQRLNVQLGQCKKHSCDANAIFSRIEEGVHNTLLETLDTCNKYWNTYNENISTVLASLSDELAKLYRAKKKWELGDAHLQPDEDATKCPHCFATFTTFVRRHHCRRCKRVICGKEACCKWPNNQRVCVFCVEDPNGNSATSVKQTC
jgi:hypothetical protein